MFVCLITKFTTQQWPTLFRIFCTRNILRLTQIALSANAAFVGADQFPCRMAFGETLPALESVLNSLLCKFFLR
jgi:hypothetical protein